MSLPFTFHTAWGGMDAADARDVTAFWLAEKALADEAAARERLPQVVMLARDRGSGSVAGVCSAVPWTPPVPGVPLYYYRTFIGQAWRGSRLVGYLLERGCRVLAADAAARDWPCVGVLLELESPAFRRPGRCRKAVMWKPPFTYLGTSPRGHELRVHYFPGAPLPG